MQITNKMKGTRKKSPTISTPIPPPKNKIKIKNWGTNQNSTPSRTAALMNTHYTIFMFL